MAVELAVGYVSLVPSAKDFGRELTRQLSSQLDDVGQKLGKKVGDDVGDGVSDGMDDAGTKGSSKFGSSFLPGMAALAGVAGAALATGLLAAFDAGMERTRDNARLAGQLGLSPEEAKRIAGVASDVYTDAWGGSVRDVNDAIRSINGTLTDVADTSDDELKRITIGALAVSDVFEQDINQVVKTAGTLMKNGLAPDAEKAFDIITKGFQTGANRADDLLDTLNEYAEPFASLGFTGAEALAVINRGLDAGAFNADKVGDAIKEFSIRAIDGSKLTGEAFKTIGLDAEAMATAVANGGPAAQAAFNQILTGLLAVEDPLARDAAAVALFGTTWEDLGPQVIASLGSTDLAIQSTDGTLNELIATQDTAAAKWETWKREVQEKFVNFMANTVIPFIEEKIIPKLERIQQAFEEDGLGGALDEMKRLWEESWPEIERWLGEALDSLVEEIVAHGPDFYQAGVDIGSDIGGGILDALTDQLGLDFIPGKSLYNQLNEAINPLERGRKAFGGLRDLFKADGGPVKAGQPYIVGERQPELFVPRTSGYVYPDVPASGGGGNTYQLTTITAKSDRTVTQEFALMELVAGFN